MELLEDDRPKDWSSLSVKWWWWRWREQEVSLMCVKFFYACMLSRSITSSSFATLWTVAHQAPLSMGFPRREYWSGLPISSSRDGTPVSCIGRKILHH